VTASAIRDGEYRSAISNRAPGVREPLRERNIGFALLRWLLRPTAERHAFEREGTGSK